MANLQRHYLSQVELALEYTLHRNKRMCLEICWELHLKPDLAIYARSVVNLIIAGNASVEEHPDKPKFALESLRLAFKLQEDDGRNERNIWLENEARTMLDLIKKEKEWYEQRKAEEEDGEGQGSHAGAIEDAREGLQFSETPQPEPMPDAVKEHDEDDEDDGVDVFFDDSEEEKEIVPWTLEGAFTPELVPEEGTDEMEEVG